MYFCQVTTTFPGRQLEFCHISRTFPRISLKNCFQTVSRIRSHFYFFLVIWGHVYHTTRSFPGKHIESTCFCTMQTNIFLVSSLRPCICAMLSGLFLGTEQKPCKFATLSGLPGTRLEFCGVTRYIPWKQFKSRFPNNFGFGPILWVIPGNPQYLAVLPGLFLVIK